MPLAAARLARDATDQLFLAPGTGPAGRFSRQMGQRLDSLDALARAARIQPDERLRDEAIAAMALPDVRRVPSRSLLRSPAPSRWRTTGRYRRLRPRGHRRDHQHPQPPRRPGGPAHPLGPDLGEYLFFSPDDRFLLGRGDGHTLRVWRVADGQQIHPGRAPRMPRRTRSARTAGRLAVGSSREWVLCFDLATGQEVHRWRLPAQALAIGVSPGRAANWPSATPFSNVASVYRRGERGPPHRPARRAGARPGRRLAPGRGAAWPSPVPTRGFRSGTWPRTAEWRPWRATCRIVTDADVPPGRRPPGLARLGRRPAALGPFYGPAAAAVAPHRQRLIPRFSGDGRWLGGRAARRQAEPAGSDAEPRIPHPGQQRRAPRTRARTTATSARTVACWR